MDVDAIQPGLYFVEVVQEAVGSCDALIALIGKEFPMGAAGGGWKIRKTWLDWRLPPPWPGIFG